MGKVGGLALVAVMALTGCAAASAGPATNRTTVQPGEVPTVRVGIYAAMPDSDFANVERRLCATFAAGHTVDDVAHVQQDLFGPEAAAQMRIVATSVKQLRCR